MGTRSPVRLFLYAASLLAAAHAVLSLIALPGIEIAPWLRDTANLLTALGIAALLFVGGCRAMFRNRFHAATGLGLLTAVVGCMATAVSYRYPVFTVGVPHAIDVLAYVAALLALLVLAWHEILSQDETNDALPQDD